MSTKFYVVEALYTDPNDYQTIIKGTSKQYGPLIKREAEALQKELAFKNIDEYQHRVRIITRENIIV